MIIPTRSITDGSIRVEEWIIFELESFVPAAKTVTPGEKQIDRHIFGFSPDTGLWQLSSKILEETDEYIQTRSRKYYKLGPSVNELPIDGTAQLIEFLHAWRVSIDEIQEIIAKYSPYHLSDDGAIDPDPTT